MSFAISIIHLTVSITTLMLIASDLFEAGFYDRGYITDEQLSLVCPVTDYRSYGNNDEQVSALESSLSLPTGVAVDP